MGMDGFDIAASAPFLVLLALGCIAWLLRRRIGSRSDIGSLTYDKGTKID